MAVPLVIEVNHVDGQTILLNTRAAYRTGMRLAIRIVVKGG